MGLPNDFRGIPVRAGPRQKWTVAVQCADQGFGPYPVLSVQGGTFAPAKKTEGAQFGVQPPCKVAALYVVGVPYFDTRQGLEHTVQTFDIENYSEASPTEYLTDPTTGLPSGATRVGAFAVGVVETVTIQSTGGDPTTAGAAQVEAQQTLDLIATERGELSGPGPGAVTDDYLQELNAFLDAARAQRADEIEVVQKGGLPTGANWQVATTSAQQTTNGGAVPVADEQTARVLNGLLIVAGVFGFLKLAKLI